MRYKSKKRIVFIVLVVSLMFMALVWIVMGFAVVLQLYNEDFGLDYPENVIVTIVYFAFSVILAVVLPTAIWLDVHMQKLKINQYINGEAFPNSVKHSFSGNEVAYIYKEKLFSPKHVWILYALLLITLLTSLIIAVLTSTVYVDILLFTILVIIIISFNPKLTTIITYKNGIFSYHQGTEVYIRTTSIENIVLKEKPNSYIVLITSSKGDAIEFECYKKTVYNAILYHLQKIIDDKWNSVIDSTRIRYTTRSP